MISGMEAARDGRGAMDLWDPLLGMSECQEPDGALRLTLTGELDISVASRLGRRLSQLRRSSWRVRLDLSELEFMDCAGVDVIIGAVAKGRGAVVVDRHVSPRVGRVVSLARAADGLWPQPASAAVVASA